MRSFLLTAGLLCAFTATAQDAPKPADLTADQIIEKSIEATGGRKAIAKLTSSVGKGQMDMGGMGSGSIEIYAKAPNKLLTLINFSGVGDIKQGFDGTTAWSSNPMQGLTEMTGDQAAAFKRNAVFQGALKWKEMYSKAALKGKEKFGERTAYAIEMTPLEGSAVTSYYDAENFLPIGSAVTVDSPQGKMDVKTEMSDYRDIGDGVKAPFVLKQILPMGEMVIKFTEFKTNVAIDDAKFAKPAEK